MADEDDIIEQVSDIMRSHIPQTNQLSVTNLTNGRIAVMFTKCEGDLGLTQVVKELLSVGETELEVVGDTSKPTFRVIITPHSRSAQKSNLSFTQLLSFLCAFLCILWGIYQGWTPHSDGAKRS